MVCRARIVSTLGHGQIYYSPHHRTVPASIGDRETGRAAVAKGVFMGRKPSLEQKWREQGDAFRREAEKLPTAKSANSCCAWRASWRPHPTSTNGYRRRDCRHRSKAMADYRSYIVGHDGHFSDCEARFCDEDSDAIDWARKLVTDFAIELWCGEHFVASIEPKPK